MDDDKLPITKIINNLPEAKHPGGRPLKYPDPEILEQKINDYFEICDAGRQTQSVTKRGEVIQINKPIPYTYEGLAYHLDCDTDLFKNYEKRDEFFPIISRARQKIKSSWVSKGLGDDHNAKIVALCLAAHDPAYRINKLEITGPGGGPVQFQLDARVQVLLSRITARAAGDQDDDVI
jgi:hypothetical protein